MTFWKHAKRPAERQSIGTMARPGLIRVLDKEFSFYVRGSAILNGNGMARCVTCGKVGQFEDFDCGHFVNRDNMATRYDVRNVAPQCYVCNRLHDGRKTEFRAGLAKRDGEVSVIQVERLNQMPWFVSDPEIVEMIQAYRAMNKVIRKKLSQL